jgi:hypothetical protein
MERVAVFILFLVINLAGVGTAGPPPEPGSSLEAKVAPAQVMVQKITPQTQPFWLAGVETVNESLASQG